MCRLTWDSTLPYLLFPVLRTQIHYCTTTRHTCEHKQPGVIQRQQWFTQQCIEAFHSVSFIDYHRLPFNLPEEFYVHLERFVGCDQHVELGVCEVLVVVVRPFIRAAVLAVIFIARVHHSILQKRHQAWRTIVGKKDRFHYFVFSNKLCVSVAINNK